MAESIAATHTHLPDRGLMRILLEQAPAAIALFDREACLISCNRRWADLFRNHGGLATVGESPLTRDARLRARYLPFFEKALSGQATEIEHDRFELDDGRMEWLHWSATPWSSDDGLVEGALVRAEVRTARIEQQLRTRLLNEELSLFIDIAGQFALSMLNDDGTIAIWNSGAERQFGWTEAEALGSSVDMLFTPEDRKHGLPARQLDAARKNGTFRDRSWRLRKDGSQLLAEVTITRIDGDEHLPGGFGQMIRDVTKEDAQSRSLEASTVLLRSILDTVPDAMIVIDERGIIMFLSKTAEALFGYDQAEVVGRNISMLMPSPDRERHDGYLARYCRTGVRRIIGSSRRVTGLRKDGSTFPHQLCVGEAFAGGRRLFTGFIHDLSEQEQAEARLEELQKELAHVARISEMGTLATVIAHELNQPLMAIGNLVQTSVELVENGDSTARSLVAAALEDAGQQTLRAGEIIKRLRNFLSRGDMEKTVEDPGCLAREACLLASTGARSRKIACPIDIAADVPNVVVDRVQIQQVILNLVRNAIDAIGKDGEVRLSIDYDGVMVCFTVEDTGPGIPPESRARLFEPFNTTKAAGMGLGLAICRTIVEAHGGKLWFQPAAGGRGGIPVHNSRDGRGGER